MWDLLASAIEPVSPALVGSFFTTEPPGSLGSMLLQKEETRTFYHGRSQQAGGGLLREQTGGCQGRGGGMEWEFGVSRYKLLYREWITTRCYIYPRELYTISCDKPQWKRIYVVVLFSHSVLSDFLWPHGQQHIRLPCPSLSPRVCSNSCALSWWCYPTVVPFSSCLQSFPASGSFPISRLFAPSGQRIGASASVLQWIFKAQFL